MSRYVIPVLAVIIVVALFFTVIQPGFARIQKTDGELAEYRQAIERADLLRARIDELTAVRNRIIPADLVRLEAFLPEKIDTVKLALLLDTVASRSDMVISNIDIETEVPLGESEEIDPTTGLPFVAAGTPGQQFRRTAISFSALGTYEQFRAVIADLERNLVLMDIAELEISQETEPVAGASVYNVAVHVYEYDASR